jgi:hypothetical protein
MNINEQENQPDQGFERRQQDAKWGRLVLERVLKKNLD